MRGSEATEPERAERAREGGCGRAGCPPSHSESFLHFDVVNGAIWCICPVFSSYSTNLYESRQLHMHTRNFIFLFFPLSLSFFCIFFYFFFLGGGRPPPPPPPPPPWLRAWLRNEQRSPVILRKWGGGGGVRGYRTLDNNSDSFDKHVSPLIAVFWCNFAIFDSRPYHCLTNVFSHA